MVCASYPLRAYLLNIGRVMTKCRELLLLRHLAGKLLRGDMPRLLPVPRGLLLSLLLYERYQVYEELITKLLGLEVNLFTLV